MILFVGMLFTVAFTFFVGLLGGGVILFIDCPSLLVIVVPLIFFLSTTRSGRVMSGYIKSSFKSDHKYGPAELDIIVAATKNTVKFTLATGWFGFFAGLIITLANLNNPLQIGPSLAVSLITIYYAIAISYFVFFPVQVWAENKAMIIENE